MMTAVLGLEAMDMDIYGIWNGLRWEVKAADCHIDDLELSVNIDDMHAECANYACNLG